MMMEEDKKSLLLEQQIGRLSKLSGPFGNVPLVYADWTASGRGLTRIEDFVTKKILPIYGNTHTATSACGIQSSLFVEEARRIVGEYCGAVTSGKAAADAVLFSGYGTTSALCHLARLLVRNKSSTTIFVGFYEHHSNLLPWRETGAKILTIRQSTSTGALDLNHLEILLRNETTSGKRLLIGAFSAASNLTGRICQIDQISNLLKSYHALVCFDYATLAPHQAPKISNTIDAVVFSCHKFLGGQGAPGILIVKKYLLDSTQAPTLPGGGSVFYVSQQGHRYLSNKIEREQGGSPDVVNIARAGLALDLARKNLSAQHWTKKLMLQSTCFNGGKSLKLLGGIQDNDLPILPFVIQCGSRLLHFNFVCQLLNDVFGIQCRGGCQCAGPYAQSLLGIDPISSECIELALVTRKQSEMLRPGLTRISLGATDAHTSEEEVKYIMDALILVSLYGWRLLPAYHLDTTNGEFRHASRFSKPLGSARLWLADAWKKEDKDYSQPHSIKNLCENLQKGRDILLAPQPQKNIAIHDLGDLEPLRWFLLPHEAAERLAMEKSPAAWLPATILEGPLQLASKLSSSNNIQALLEALRKEQVETPRTAKKPLRSLSSLEGSISPDLNTSVVSDQAYPDIDTTKADFPDIEKISRPLSPAKIERKRPPKKITQVCW
mmetsp:Transcript_13760/g.20546  ORF Transcript_13760/g.20546 Transcript_13760/m.20546 type:complete len:664 (+) Transcript_13760:33-2024(+)